MSSNAMILFRKEGGRKMACNRRRAYRWWLPTLLIADAAVVAMAPSSALAAGLSGDTEECLACHEEVTPGIVEDWRSSRHANTSLADALAKPEIERRVSVAEVTEELMNVVVGCAECHMARAESHPDTFDHAGLDVHTVVSPPDCARCHPVEVEEYSHNLMANAYANLAENPLYGTLVEAVNGVQSWDGERLIQHPSDALTDADSCFSCHGTKVEAGELVERETMLGSMEFPELSGWPNQGVGRINPDGSKGACTACHTRHAFSIEMARKPYTCAQCHKGPDVPVYPVYMVSKHGNIFSSMKEKWDFDAVPWEAGEDFTAPTCATCHISLVTSAGDVVGQRTHRMNDRLPWRLFGLIYAHPHPLSADTTIIRNQAGLPLPTELTGEPASKFLIDSAEQAVREGRMRAVCSACHTGQWIGGHFAKLDHTIETTNAMTATATKMMSTAWETAAAHGLAHQSSLFDEALEQRWSSQWLFYANSTRFASAMGGADYGVFANGRYSMSGKLREMSDWLEFLRVSKEKTTEEIE
ncbi:MAG: multiheme c-type cytochrome [Acidobacteriota bacterium]|nr:multiheme c-type cytochrome [Acidobacteriota bacterium]